MTINQDINFFKEEVIQVINTQEPVSDEDVNKIVDIMLSLSMNEIDFCLAEALCEKFIKSKNDNLRLIAITSVGHIARVYHREVSSKVMEELRNIHQNSSHPNWGTVDDVMDDLSIYLGNRK